MGRKRKSNPPRFLMTVAATEGDAERRQELLQKAARSGRGRPPRWDLLRDAMALADLIPPTPRDKWRRHKRKGVAAPEPTARREARAASTLIQIYAERGEILTVANATRAMEQGRKANDTARGISVKDRRTIEAARVQLARINHPKELPVLLNRRELAILRQAVKAIQNAPTASPWDLEFLDGLRSIEPSVKVH